MVTAGHRFGEWTSLTVRSWEVRRRSRTPARRTDPYQLIRIPLASPIPSRESTARHTARRATARSSPPRCEPAPGRHGGQQQRHRLCLISQLVHDGSEYSMPRSSAAVLALMQARRWAASSLTALDDSHLADGLLVTTELVTNAWDHGNGPLQSG
jgi:hypothetical protein